MKPRTWIVGLSSLLFLGSWGIWGVHLRVADSAVTRARPSSPSIRVAPEFQPGPVAIPGRDVSFVIRPAPELNLPPIPDAAFQHDCNNPMFWDGENFHVYSSFMHPFRASGPDLAHLNQPSTRTHIDNESGWDQGGRWLEAVHKVEGGRLYGWYHNEPPGQFPGHPNRGLSAPRIGQMWSEDNGLHWHDQGIILEAPADSFEPATANVYFGGGVGDFSVIASRDGRELYFLLSTYDKAVDRQGVSIARMSASYLDAPVERVTKWHDGRWDQPGLGGVATPIFPAAASWHDQDSRVHWGPSVHWNTYLEQYVIIMNMAANSAFGQDGAYISLNPRLDDPTGWSEPVKVLDVRGWYPQIIGTDASANESDRLAGLKARLFVRGKSTWEIEFLKGAEGRQPVARAG